MKYQGNLRKMKTSLSGNGEVQYDLPVGESLVPMGPLLGNRLCLTFLGAIHCIHCGRKTSKSFNQGYCFPCFRKLARCDTCIVKPELCHYHQGTCREPEWGEAHCFQPHVIYLANSSDLKVGITRRSQIPTRWMDQGAVQALPILEVSSRYLAGLVEVCLKQYVSDRTQWQRMLKAQAPAIDLISERQRLLTECEPQLAELKQSFEEDAIKRLPDAEVSILTYPVLEYPVKVKSFNLDKVPRAGGRLLGVKGQYLIFDQGVINIRKFAGYEVEVALQSEV